MRLIAVLTAGFLLAVAAPASAGTLTTQNTCRWSDGYRRHMNIELGGIATPSPVAPGSGVTLTQASARVVLPEYLAQAGLGAELLQPGPNEIPAKAWLAIAAPGTSEGVQVLALDAVARTTITADETGAYVSSTPIDVTVPLPDTVWTAGSAPISFAQGAAGTLPRIPVGPGGALVLPSGSAYISATVGNGVKFNIDCQPGSGEGTGPFTAAAAGPFESVAIDAAAPPVPAPAPKSPVVTLRTTKLKRVGSRVSIALACADASCKGQISLGSAGARKRSYSLAAGARKTYKLKLSQRALKRLKAKKPVLVTVKVTSSGGKTVSKKLRLKK